MKEMIEAQKARAVEESEKPFGSNFVAFLRASKPEIANIFFAFVCVLLAYQVHGMRAGIRKLQAEREEKNAEIENLRGILAGMCEGTVGSSEDITDDDNDSFAARLARKCAGVVRDTFEESEKRAGYSWILGKKLASGDSLELGKLVDGLRPVILSEVQSAVGDAAFTPEELKERRVIALKEENESHARPITVDGHRDAYGSGKRDAQQMGDLMEILEEVHNQDLTDERDASGGDDGNSTAKTVRRTRYAI